jgi:hypothetical protein
MQKLFVIAIVCVLFWHGYESYQSYSYDEDETPDDMSEIFVDERGDDMPEAPAPRLVTKPPAERANFTCDGRIYCSQMTSCDEAIYFLENCPGVKMDGGRHDGVPCERQHCGDR